MNTRQIQTCLPKLWLRGREKHRQNVPVTRHTGLPRPRGKENCRFPAFATSPRWALSVQQNGGESDVPGRSGQGPPPSLRDRASNRGNLSCREGLSISWLLHAIISITWGTRLLEVSDRLRSGRYLTRPRHGLILYHSLLPTPSLPPGPQVTCQKHHCTRKTGACQLLTPKHAHRENVSGSMD